MGDSLELLRGAAGPARDTTPGHESQPGAGLFADAIGVAWAIHLSTHSRLAGSHPERV